MPARPPAEYSDDTLTESNQGGGASAAAQTVTAPHLLVALECARPAAGVTRHSLANIDRVTIGRASARTFERAFEGSSRALRVSIPDRRMSTWHACIVREAGSFTLQDLGSRNGTRLNGVDITAPTALVDQDVIESGHTLFRYRDALTAPLGEPADADSGNGGESSLLVTIDPSLARRVAALTRVARSGSPVLLLGETGTGKELLARAIHRASGRTGRFVAINCGSLPATLVEAQLFGHVRGSFSGAVSDARGLLRSAEGGTILLDEIGDLPVAAQTALLRVLQEQEVVPVGGEQPVKVAFRALAATHRPLELLVAQGHFRGDLLARLAGFTFSLPPLRERRDDIGLFVAALTRDASLRFTPAAGRALLGYDWPLNVRELRHALGVAATLAGDAAIDLEHLPARVAVSSSPSAVARREPPKADPLHQQLLALLARHEGNVSEVARELGKARTQVQRWMKRYGIDARSFRGM